MSRRPRTVDSSPRRFARHDYRDRVVTVSSPTPFRLTPLRFTIALTLFVTLEVVLIAALILPGKLAPQRAEPSIPAAAPAQVPATSTESDVFPLLTDSETNPYAASGKPLGMAEGAAAAEDALFTMSSGGSGLAGASGRGGARTSSRRSRSQASGDPFLGGGFDEVIVLVRPAGEGAARRSTLKIVDAGGVVSSALPLRSTDVVANITGGVSAVTVTQRFVNDADRPIEAVYSFPLPGDAAIGGFLMEAGGRRVLGVVKEKEEAKKTYAEARARGYAAALLDQDGASTFTERIANIAAAAEVSIRITYFQRVRFLGGAYEFVFPTALAEAYDGSPAAKSKESATVVADPSDLSVPEAPPHATAPASLTSHVFDLVLDLKTPLPIAELTIPTHRTVVETVDERHRIVRLMDDDRTPNRDFICRYRLTSDETATGLAAAQSRNGTFFALTVQPDATPEEADLTPREITFIVDTSGSMQGMPIKTARAIVTHAVENLRSGEVFNVITFASASRRLFEAPVVADDTSVARVREFLEETPASGGTEMMNGLRRALEAPHDANRLQMYVLLTDGMITEEGAILDLIARDTSGARFFAYGQGPNVNRGFLDRIGELGRGRTLYANTRDWAASVACADRVLELIEKPVLVDPVIDWNGLPVADVYPAQRRDIFSGGRLECFGRFTGPAEGTAYLRGRVGARSVAIPFRVSSNESVNDDGAIEALWTRARIADLEGDLRRSTDPAARETMRAEIVRLAIADSLETPWTSFVAVDRDAAPGDGVVRPIRQPATALEETDATAFGIVVERDSHGRLRVVRVDPGAAEKAGVKKDDYVISVGDAELSADQPSPEDSLTRNSTRVIVCLSADGSIRRRVTLDR